MFSLVYSSAVRRSRPPLKLHRSPLVFVLGQVGISPILQMATYVPAIQERLRKSGYPGFAESLTQNILLAPGGPPEVRTSSRWLFKSRDARSAVVLSSDFVAFETTSYDTFDVFAEQFRDMLTIIGTEASIELAERVGLRYVDRVRSQEPAEDGITGYLDERILGVATQSLGLHDDQSRYVVQAKSALGDFRFRLERGRGVGALPPELQADDLAMDVGDDAGEYAILDFDHFSLATRLYEPEPLVDVLWDLHDLVDLAFRSATTPFAMQQWRAEAIT